MQEPLTKRNRFVSAAVRPLSSDFNAGLSTPAVVQEQQFDIGVGKGALVIVGTDAVLAHPASENSTGGIAHTSFPGGTLHINVKGLDCGRVPPAPIKVSATADVVPHSAGHEHDAPAGTKLIDLVASFNTCTPDKSGVCQITMTGRTVSSLLKMKAHTDDWDTTDSIASPADSNEVNLAVGLPLDRWIADTSYVEACGETTLHPDNHYAQPEMNSFINLFARYYYDTKSDVVFVNDSSLALGGKFDVDGTFSGSHAFHRFGVDVDMCKRVRKPDGTIEQWDPAKNEGLDVDALTDYVELILGDSRYPEGADRVHYRFPADGIDNIIQTRILP